MVKPRIIRGVTNRHALSLGTFLGMVTAVVLPTIIYGYGLWESPALLKAAHSAWYKTIKVVLNWNDSISPQSMMKALAVSSAGAYRANFRRGMCIRVHQPAPPSR